MSDKQHKKMEDLMILMDIQDAIPLLYAKKDNKKLLKKLKFV